MINLNKIKDDGLVRLYSALIKELKDRKIIRTKNIIGDLGEYLAIYHYNNTPGLPNLQAAPAGTQNIDAISRNGERYSVKSSSGNLTGVFYGLNDPNSKYIEHQKFEFVVIVKFKDDFELDKILELPWDKFLVHKKWHKTMRAWNLSFSKKMINDCNIIYDTEN